MSGYIPTDVELCFLAPSCSSSRFGKGGFWICRAVHAPSPIYSRGVERSIVALWRRFQNNFPATIAKGSNLVVDGVVLLITITYEQILT